MSQDTTNFIVGLVFIIVVVLVIVLLVKRSNKKKRGQAWQGTVTDKKATSSTDEDGEVTNFYHLTVAIDGAQKPKKLSVDEATFKALAVGDRIEKKLGDLQPSKV